MAAGALLGELYFSGSRLSTGEPNETGTLFCYLPETISPASLYTDAELTSIATQPITLDNGGRIPYDTYPNGLWVTQPVRLLIQDSSGATVSDATFYPATADNVSVGNDGFTGITMDQVLDAAFASTGGQDFKYKESGGATERLVQDKFREIWISVKDFGAVGNGIAIDTTAIQTAMNRAVALGGSVVYFPAGTYKIDQALTMSSATGVSIVGAGINASVLTTTHASANLFTFTSCTGFRIENLFTYSNGLNSGGSSSGTGFAFTDCTAVTMRHVQNGGGAGGTFAVNVSAVVGSGLSNTFTIENCTFHQTGASYNIILTNTSAVIVRGSTLDMGSANGIQIGSSTSLVTVADTIFSAASGGCKGLVWTSGGGSVVVYACPTLGIGFTGTIPATPFDLSALSTDPVFRQWGNEVEGATYSAAVGNTLTILRSGGSDVRLVAASGGAGTMTVAAPTPTPTATMRNVRLTTRHINGSGGAVTWTMNAVFVLGGGTAIPTTDGHTIIVNWEWDGTTSKWREMSRADTVT